MKKLSFNVPMGARLVLLLCAFFLCLIITSFLAYALRRVCNNPWVLAMMQDIILFILPAVITAIIVTRFPADLLGLRAGTRLTTVLLAIGTMAVAIPAQEAVIVWNNNISLPESMAAYEEFAKTMEANAAQSIEWMMRHTSVAGLITNLLVVGLGAGIAEELLFRGCFLRLLTTGGVNKHLAVWIVAIIFSAMHLQFYGFVPRTLLGAFFGYLMIWSGSLWLPVIAHTLNNMTYVVSSFILLRNDPGASLQAQNTEWSPLMIVVSVLLTAVGLYLLWRHRRITAEE